MFREVKPNRIYQDVVGQIEEAIISGRLKPGDKLPPERELKDAFNTSRRTLREGLRILESMGLIEIRTGARGGAFVKDASSDEIRRSLGLLIRRRQTSLAELAEFREGVEGAAAALAAEKARPEDLARLEELLAQAGDLAAQGPAHWEEFLEIESRLHLTLTRMSGNLLYESVASTVLENIGTYYQDYLPRTREMLEEDYEDWRSIVKAIRRGHNRRATELIRDHISKFSRYMMDGQKQAAEATNAGSAVTGSKK